jgi:phage shock protein A
MASGALDDLGGRRDDIQSELDAIGAGSDVEQDLARLRGEIAASSTKQIEGGTNGDGQQAQHQQAQGTQTQAAPAGFPSVDLPSANEPAQDGEGL